MIGIGVSVGCVGSYVTAPGTGDDTAGRQSYWRSGED